MGFHPCFDRAVPGHFAERHEQSEAEKSDFPGALAQDGYQPPALESLEHLMDFGFFRRALLHLHHLDFGSYGHVRHHGFRQT